MFLIFIGNKLSVDSETRITPGEELLRKVIAIMALELYYQKLIKFNLGSASSQDLLKHDSSVARVKKLRVFSRLTNLVFDFVFMIAGQLCTCQPNFR